MAPTVISYRAPASYRRCGANLYDSRGTRYIASNTYSTPARYVAVRNIDYDNDNVRYVALRNYVPRTRYVAVRNIDYDNDDVRYVAVRNYAPRTQYVAVRNIDYDNDNVRYVALRNYAPRTKYVAVRNIDYGDNDVRYVAVRNYAPRTQYVRHIDDDGCPRAVALRGCSDEFETANTRRIVLRDNDDTDTRYVAVQTESDDDAYIPAPREVNHIAYRDTAYYDANDETYVPVNDTVSIRTVSYRPVSAYDNDEIDDQAFLDEDGATYVAADNIENACLKPMAVESSPAYMGTREVSYVPAEYVDNDDQTYVAVENTAPSTRYAVVKDDDSIDAESVNYIPVENVAGQPVYTDDDSTVLVDESGVELTTTQQIAGNFGYSDGFEDGRDAAVEGDVYHPENSGDYKKATEGYEDTFGDKDVYKDGYRSSYLQGYRAGFESINGSS